MYVSSEQDHAKKGTLRLSNTPVASAWEARKRFVLRTLTGDEMRRPLVAESFNTGEADSNARKLVEKMAMWRKIKNAKGGMMDRLMVRLPPNDFPIFSTVFHGFRWFLRGFPANTRFTAEDAVDINIRAER